MVRMVKDESQTLDEDVPVSVRVQLIHDQLALARAIVWEAQARPLNPEERFAISQLGTALAELTDAVRALLIDWPP